MANEEPINFDNAPDTDAGLSLDDFSGESYIKNPEVGETVILEVQKIVRSDKTRGKTAEGQDFDIGVKQKDGQVKRFDIHCTNGIFTVSNWEVYFKLFKQPDGVLVKYAREHGRTFAGAKVSIKRNLNGGHATEKIPNLMKLLDFTTPEAAMKYQEEVKLAKKEQRLYEVKLV